MRVERRRDAAVAVLGVFLLGCSSTRPCLEIRVITATEGARTSIEGAEKLWAEILDWRGESAIRVVSEPPVWFLETRHIDYFFCGFFCGYGHGWYITRAAWSPAGPYLAYQYTSSGGHQPYYSPITVLDLTNQEAVDMDELLEKLHPDPEWTCVTDPGRELFWSAEGKLHFYALVGEEWKIREFTYDPAMKGIVAVEEGPRTGLDKD